MRYATSDFSFEALVEREHDMGGQYIAEYRGFLHPLGAAALNGGALQVFLVSINALSILYISPEERQVHKVRHYRDWHL